MAVLLQQPASDLARIEQRVRRLKYVGVLVQLLLVASIGAFWRPIVDWGRTRGVVKAFEYERVLALRWKVVAFLGVFILVVVIGPGEIHRLVKTGL